MVPVVLGFPILFNAFVALVAPGGLGGFDIDVLDSLVFVEFPLQFYVVECQWRCRAGLLALRR